MRSSSITAASVEVLGMVARPGAYLLAGFRSSPLDMIGRAGGMIAGSAQRVVLFPATPGAAVTTASNNGPLQVACADNGGAASAYGAATGNSNCAHLVNAAAVAGGRRHGRRSARAGWRFGAGEG